MMKRVVKLLLSLPFLLALGAVGVYALGGFVVAPWWIKRELPQYLKTHLNASGTVGDIAINPFKLTLTVGDFAVTESGGTQPALAFDRLFVNFESSSLFRRAWTFAEIALENPRANLEVDANGALNLVRLVPADKGSKQEPLTGLPRLLLEKLALKHGRVSFTDKGISKPATARVEPIEFELHDLSTLPDRRGDYTLAARLPAGGTLGWRGSVTLAPIASTGQIELKDAKLALPWQFIQDRLLIDEPRGSANLSLQYSAGYAASKLDASASNIALTLNDVVLRHKGAAEPLFTAAKSAWSGGKFSYADRSIRFAEFTLSQATARVVFDAEGKVNWAQLAAASRTAAAAAATAEAAGAAPWKAGIDAIHVTDTRLQVLDEGFVRPLAIDITRADLRSRVDVSLGAQTSVRLENLASELENVRVSEAGVAEPLIALAAASLSEGAFDLAQNKFTAEAVKLNKPVAAVMRDDKGIINLLAAFARKLVKPPAVPPFTAEIRAIELSDGAVALQDRSNEPALALDLQGIRVLLKNVSNAAKSNVPFEAALQIKQGGTLRAQGSATPDEQRATVKLELRDFALAPLAALVEKHTTLKLTAGVAQAAGQLDWSGQGNAAGIRYAGTAGLDGFRFGADANAPAAAVPAAAVRVQGTLSSAPQRASLKVEARNIALTPLAALVAKHTTLKLVSGAAYAAGQLEWSGQGTGAGARYTGSAGIDDFRVDQEGNSERLVSWKGLLAEGIQADSAGRLARVADVRLSGISGKMAIAKDRSTNLAGILRKPAGTPPAAGDKPAASGAQPASEAPFSVNVERVHVSSGELDFSDQSLVLPFAALIQEFNGTVTGLSTQPDARASLQFEGRVDEFGQAQFNGTVNPLHPTAFMDIVAKFRNIAMPPLTPYSATFAGRRIASGKLSLDLQYKIINSQLLGENKVLLEQFTLGERVESPTAVNLPLDLAIALLTDSDGKIDLSVPVRGNVDSPEFAYGQLVWQAIRTVITNIVTAPFRALASLFGSGAEKVDAIGFAAGRSQLAPPEREKLTRVAGVLKQRPQLRLVVEGRYDPSHDGAALRTVAARRVLAERQDIKVTGAEDLALVNFDSAKTQRAIEALLEERAGKDSVDKFKADHEKSTGKAVSRVNPALALIGRGSADRQF